MTTWVGSYKPAVLSVLCPKASNGKANLSSTLWESKMNEWFVAIFIRYETSNDIREFMICCSIGPLTEEDVQFFVTKSKIKESPAFWLYNNTLVASASENLQYEFEKAKQLFDDLLRDMRGMQEAFMMTDWQVEGVRDAVVLMNGYQKTAELIRKMHKSEPVKSIAVPPVVTATSAAKAPVPILAARKGEKEKFKKTLEGEKKRMFAPDKMVLEGVNPDVRKELADDIGKHTAKYLIRDYLSEGNPEIREQGLLEIGFEPIEVTEKLYPNAKEKERRRISQRISNNKGKRKKTS
jgi:hypothetical protein